MKTISSKTFLSDNPDEFGSIGWSVEGHHMNNPAKKSANLTLKDCYKRIDLEFYYSGFNEYESRIKKIDTLINELSDFREALRDSWGTK